MADEDYGDDDAFYYDDDDYLYVEDDYAVADELAETQVPSPGYTGVNDEIAMEGFEYDVYEYFGELEYGSDSYWDARMKHLSEAGLGKKRKSGDEEDTEDRMVKKRRKDGGRGDVQEVRDNVLYVPFEKRLVPLPPRVEQSEEGRFALLPDWKERFPEKGSPVAKKRQMPAEMRKAAEEVVDEDEDGENGSVDREDGDDMETGEDGEYEEDEEDGDGEEEGSAGLDQDLVMQILRQKLADSGLGDVDESMFKEAIAKMMAGNGDSEDAVGGLASLLLGQEGGGGKAFEGFLAEQGVELGRAEGDDDGGGSESESKDEDNETDPRPTKKAKANPTSTKSRKPSTTTTSSSAARSKAASQTPSTSRARSKTSETTAFHESPSATRTSPTVVPSPLPPAIVAAASSTQPSRKRRAPSLDEPSVPPPPQVATAATSSAKPPAKRSRATPASSRSETPADDSEPGPTRRRTTRSAAAAAEKGKGKS